VLAGCFTREWKTGGGAEVFISPGATSLPLKIDAVRQRCVHCWPGPHGQRQGHFSDALGIVIAPCLE